MWQRKGLATGVHADSSEPSKAKRGLLYSQFSLTFISPLFYPPLVLPFCFIPLVLSDPFSSPVPFLSFLFISLFFPFPLQEVVATEKTRGSQLLEEPKMLPFRANTFSLQVSIQDVPQFLWSIKPFTTCQVTTAATDKPLNHNILQILEC